MQTHAAEMRDDVKQVFVSIKLQITSRANPNVDDLSFNQSPNCSVGNLPLNCLYTYLHTAHFHIWRIHLFVAWKCTFLLWKSSCHCHLLPLPAILTHYNKLSRIIIAAVILYDNIKGIILNFKSSLKICECMIIKLIKEKCNIYVKADFLTGTLWTNERERKHKYIKSTYASGCFEANCPFTFYFVIIIFFQLASVRHGDLFQLTRKVRTFPKMQ